MNRRFGFLCAILIAGISVTGCSDEGMSADSSGATSLAGQSGNQSQGGAMLESNEAGTIIDVRTPGEFAEGHLDGAINIDVSDPAFEALISDLDMNGKYSVYCRSGNRSAQAVALMEQKGFTNVENLGGLADAANALGVEVVK